MEANHPTAGWEKVGDRFYRKTQVYTAIFDQDLELDNYIVAGAVYGGAIGKGCVYLGFHSPFYHLDVISCWWPINEVDSLASRFGWISYAHWFPSKATHSNIVIQHFIEMRASSSPFGRISPPSQA